MLHAVRQHFHVDGHSGIVNPVGMVGARVEVDMHVVHGNFNRLQNPIRVVKGLQLEVERLFSTDWRHRWRCSRTNRKNWARW